MRRVIAFSGKMQAGKTTCARILQQILVDVYKIDPRDIVRLGFAAGLKEDLQKLGIDTENKHEVNRRLMQNYGAAQRARNPEYWITRWSLSAPLTGFVLVDDLRFVNEFKHLRDVEKAVLVRVAKYGDPLLGWEQNTTSVNVDVSETELDLYAAGDKFHHFASAPAGDLGPLHTAMQTVAAQLVPEGLVKLAHE